MSVSETGFIPPVSVDLFPHGFVCCFYRYATLRGSVRQEIFMLICADVSAWEFQEEINKEYHNILGVAPSH